MTDRVKVFFLTEADQVQVSLRRFVSSRDASRKCPLPWGYHDASVILGAMIAPAPAPGEHERSPEEITGKDYKGDPRWPVACGCGYVFQADDYWQLNTRRLHRGAPDGRLYTLHDAPVGAMWNADWYVEHCQGSDGMCLVVKTPGGDWLVDSRASNCDMPADDVHKCWVRHGDPRTGNVHVDKNGVTCGAGAGSIAQRNYHGFLHNGYLVRC